jgi:hypothetical protein
MWKKVSKDCCPDRLQMVWGYWKNREVAIVYHLLDKDEIDDEGIKDGNWTCVDDEKLGCVTYWKEIDYPQPPEV